ncbi:MAG: hypothetical protein WB392_09950 [Methanotrichaceae archaeon]
MIIRILGEGQYEVNSCLLDQLNVIDNRIVDHVSQGRQKEFREDLTKLISSVKENGKLLDPEEIVKSDIIVPPKDLTFEEAKGVFKGYGLIED